MITDEQKVHVVYANSVPTEVHTDRETTWDLPIRSHVVVPMTLSHEGWRHNNDGYIFRLRDGQAVTSSGDYKTCKELGASWPREYRTLTTK